MQDDEALGSPLSRAYRLQRRAARVGFDWPDARGPLAKVKEETAELEREAGDPKGLPDGRGKRETIEAELGDLLFAVVNLARKLGIDPERALARANDKFRRRFEALERLPHPPRPVVGPARPGPPGAPLGGGEKGQALPGTTFRAVAGKAT